MSLKIDKKSILLLKIKTIFIFIKNLSSRFIMKMIVGIKTSFQRFQNLFPTSEHEVTFLSYQRELREGGTKVLNEAMLVLDIIDAKTASLLNYISISLAAMVFLFTSIPTNPSFKFVLFGEKVLTISLLLVILALIGAILFCLSCLNIVGGHTIRKLECPSDEPKSQKAYEDFVIKITCKRRNRFLVAQRISICTAVFIFFVFIALFVGSVIELFQPALRLDFNKLS